MFDSIPNDPIILLSFVNTELRDTFPNLQEFCKAHSVSEDEISKKLDAVGYHYNETQNRFK